MNSEAIVTWGEFIVLLLQQALNLRMKPPFSVTIRSSDGSSPGTWVFDFDAARKLVLSKFNPNEIVSIPLPPMKIEILDANGQVGVCTVDRLEIRPD